MKRFALSFLIALFMLSSCTTNYYLMVSNTETPIYSSDATETLIATIPSNNAFIFSNPYGKVKYGTINGYSPYVVTWRKVVKLRKKQVRNLTFTSEVGYTYNEILSSSDVNSVSNTKSKTTSSSAGTVQVKGYTRKDGTYVKPHTRSAPRRH